MFVYQADSKTINIVGGKVPAAGTGVIIHEEEDGSISVTGAGTGGGSVQQDVGAGDPGSEITL